MTFEERVIIQHITDLTRIEAKVILARIVLKYHQGNAGTKSADLIEEIENVLRDWELIFKEDIYSKK